MRAESLKSQTNGGEKTRPLNPTAAKMILERKEGTVESRFILNSRKKYIKLVEI